MNDIEFKNRSFTTEHYEFSDETVYGKMLNLWRFPSHSLFNFFLDLIFDGYKCTLNIVVLPLNSKQIQTLLFLFNKIIWDREKASLDFVMKIESEENRG